MSAPFAGSDRTREDSVRRPFSPRVAASSSAITYEILPWISRILHGTRGGAAENPLDEGGARHLDALLIVVQRGEVSRVAQGDKGRVGRTHMIDQVVCIL